MKSAIRFDEQMDGWSRRKAKKTARLARIARWMTGHVLETGAIVEALETLIEPGDAVALEGTTRSRRISSLARLSRLTRRMHV
jgi:hypothetical protein